MTKPSADNSGNAATGRRPDALIGKVVRDRAKDRTGMVMDKVGPNYQLRPLAGGREWEAAPDRVEPTALKCAICAQLGVEYNKAAAEGRWVAARAFVVALTRHGRVMHA
ncbi:hypothetical protein ABT104_19430 [Streptomyces mobaraensis]|uniref:hypothetical protein n=1 Tax=Streptomyces mobaraensis TaxID=35621 RepID=UPI00331C7A0E